MRSCLSKISRCKILYDENHEALKALQETTGYFNVGPNATHLCLIYAFKTSDIPCSHEEINRQQFGYWKSISCSGHQGPIDLKPFKSVDIGVLPF